jgi:hypothetical protein
MNLTPKPNLEIILGITISNLFRKVTQVNKIQSNKKSHKSHGDRKIILSKKNNLHGDQIISPKLIKHNPILRTVILSKVLGNKNSQIVHGMPNPKKNFRIILIMNLTKKLALHGVIIITSKSKVLGEIISLMRVKLDFLTPKKGSKINNCV